MHQLQQSCVRSQHSSAQWNEGRQMKQCWIQYIKQRRCSGSGFIWSGSGGRLLANPDAAQCLKNILPFWIRIHWTACIRIKPDPKPQDCTLVNAKIRKMEPCHRETSIFLLTIRCGWNKYLVTNTKSTQTTRLLCTICNYTIFTFNTPLPHPPPPPFTPCARATREGEESKRKKMKNTKIRKGTWHARMKRKKEIVTPWPDMKNQCKGTVYPNLS